MGASSTSWWFYNLFRIVAVTFVIWALVAQFIALAKDLGELSRAKASSSGTSLSTVASSTSIQSSLGSEPTSRTHSTILTTSDAPTEVLITNSIPTTPSSRASLATIAQLGPEVITTTPPIIRPTAQALGDDPLVVGSYIKRFLNRREENVSLSGVYGRSSVPTSSGGPIFSSISRIVMASALAFLLMAQLGIPEMWLYDNAPAFGPQSTPIWLGAGQTVIAVEGLRVYSVPIVWAANVGLLVIGMINLHMAIGLIMLARRRKLPKSPSPPLYFSRTTRLLFVRPLPPCYTHTLSKDEQAEFDAKAASNPSLPQDLEIATRRTPWTMKPAPPSRKESHDQVTDIRRGGYPTSAKGGLGATGSLIPPSTLDIAADGRMRGLIAKPSDNRASLVTNGDAYSGVADDESRAPSRNDSIAAPSMKEDKRKKNSIKRRPPPLGLSFLDDQPRPEPRRQSITALREKIQQRMGRKPVLGDTDVQAVDKPLPAITTSVLKPESRTRDDKPQRSNTIGSKPPLNRQSSAILPSIPKRNHTIAHTDPHSPARRPLGVKRASSDDPTPSLDSNLPIAKSHSPHSIAPNTLSTILPWAELSRSRTSAKPTSVMSNDPEESRDQLVKRQIPTRTASFDVRQPSTRPVDHKPDNFNLKLPTQTLTRTPSGSKLQKSRKGEPVRATEPSTHATIISPPRVETLSQSSSGSQLPISRDLKAHTDASSIRSRSPSVLRKRIAPSERPTVPLSPSPSAVAPSRPGSAQSSLRPSLAPLNRSGSTRSTRSTRTAMGVRFDLAKRYSSGSSDSDSTERESLLSPETMSTDRATPKSAGFRIPGTQFYMPFPGASRSRHVAEDTAVVTFRTESYGPGSMTSSEHDHVVEAARPGSFASQSTINSTRETLIYADDTRMNKPVPERAGLPKRSASVIVTPDATNVGDDKSTRSRYVDDGQGKGWRKGHARRPSSVSNDSSLSITLR